MKSPSLLAAAVYGALLAGIYSTAYWWLIHSDWPREDYNYCYLIPLLAVYLGWEKRPELAAEASAPSWMGFLPLLFGILLFWAGHLGGELFSVYLSSWLAVVGLLWIHWGWKKLKIIGFPLLLVLSMFPPPHFINTKLTFGLKLISSRLGVAMIQMFGMSAYREGNIIDLGFTQLQVADACSGLRFFFPLILMGILLAFFYRLKIWKGALLALSAVPLAIFMNGLRIALTGIIYRMWGAEAAEGFFHGFSGWLVFMVSFGVLIGEMWGLNCISPEKQPGERGRMSGGTSPPVPGTTSPADAKAAGSDRGFMIMGNAKYFLISGALLGATVFLLGAVDFHKKAPPRKTFAQFPLQVGDWTGTRLVLEQKIIDELDLSDYIMADYRDDAGRVVNFYVAYYQSQKMGESIHSPETCLPGSGWVFRQAGTASVAVPDGKSIRVKRAVMEKLGSRQLVYFWVPARGRILTNAYEMKLLNFWDALTRQRTDAALVRITTPISDSQSSEDAEKRLQSFAASFVPLLEEFIPPE